MRLNTKGANRLHMGGGGFGRRPLFTPTAENPPCIGDARVSPKRTETKEPTQMEIEVEIEEISLSEHPTLIFSATASVDINMVDNGIGSYECHGVRGNDVRIEPEVQQVTIVELTVSNEDGDVFELFCGDPPSEVEILLAKEKHGIDLLSLLKGELSDKVDAAVDNHIDNMDLSDFCD